MTVCETCNKPLASLLYTSEMLVCERCHTHFHLVLTRNEKENMILLLNIIRDIVKVKDAPNVIAFANTMLERLTRE